MTEPTNASKKTPDASTTSGESPSAHEDDNITSNDSKRFPLKYRVITGIAGVIVLAGAGIGVKLAIAGPTPEESLATTSAPANPTEKPAPAPSSEYDQPALTGEALTQAFTLPETSKGDELAKTFVQKIQDWSQYGENLETQSGVYGHGPAILDNQSEQGGDAIASALISSEHISSPLMTDFKDKMVQDNKSIVEAWSKTYFADKNKNPFPEVDKEPFNQTLEFNSADIISTDEATGEVTMNIHFTQHADTKNLMDPTHDGTINPTDAGFARDNVAVNWQVIFVHEGGATKAKSVIFQGQ